MIIHRVIRSLISFLKKANEGNLQIDSIQENPVTGLLYLIMHINGKYASPIFKDPYDFLLEKQCNKANVLSKKDYKILIQTLLENQDRIDQMKCY